MVLGCDGGADVGTKLVNSRENSLLDHRGERKVESVLPSLQPGKEIVSIVYGVRNNVEMVME